MLVTEKSGCLADTMSGNEGCRRIKVNRLRLHMMSEWNVDCPCLLEVSVHVDEKVLTAV